MTKKCYKKMSDGRVCRGRVKGWSVGWIKLKFICDRCGWQYN